MTNRTLAALAGGTLAASLLAAAPAGATGWKVLTPPDSNTVQVSAVRTPDNVLHVAYPEPTGGGNGLAVSSIMPNGTFGATATVVSGWTSVTPPTILSTGSQLHVYFAGNHGDNTDDPLTGLDLATAGLDGAAWAVNPNRFDPLVAPAYQSDIAAVEPNGAPVEAYNGSEHLYVHAGLDPNGPFGEYQGQLQGCCGQDQNLAADTNGAVTLAWASDRPGKNGVLVQGVDPASGAPQGAPTTLSGSNAGGFDKTSSRVSMLTRTGGGVYVTYPSGFPFHHKVIVWKVGGGQWTVAKDGNEHPDATLATTPDGRLWSVWSEKVNGSVNVVEARRTNKAATVWGAPVMVKPPHGVGDLNHVVANGQAGPVDVLATYTSASSDLARTYATQLLPGITFLVTVKGAKVSVKTLDAGDALGGVKIAWGSHAKKTSKKGTVSFKVALQRHASKLTLTASKGGYTAAKVTVKLPAAK
jgi:hypothetical protein